MRLNVLVAVEGGGHCVASLRTTGETKIVTEDDGRERLGLVNEDGELVGCFDRKNILGWWRVPDECTPGDVMPWPGWRLPGAGVA